MNSHFQAAQTATPANRIGRDFYARDCVELAKKLLGQRLVSEADSSADGGRTAGYIVETEAYLGAADPAAHSYRGRTERNAAMFMQPGTCYVYSIYGQYCCVNVSSEGDGCAVLIRALAPAEGEPAMRSRRALTGEQFSKKAHELCNGPSKLCQALAIDKFKHNKADMCDPSASVYIESAPSPPANQIVTSRRIGIDGCGPAAAAKPLRFYWLGCRCVSRRDKAAEALALNSSTDAALASNAPTSDGLLTSEASRISNEPPTSKALSTSKVQLTSKVAPTSKAPPTKKKLTPTVDAESSSAIKRKRLRR